MNLRALVVEDDAGIMPAVEDVLFSMGHRLTWVTNQFDAQGAVAKEKFDYVLLDLAIPARPGGEADQQFGINLLAYFQQYDGLPVLIMTAYLAACVDLGNQLRELGARDTIAKPFKQRGRELAQKIRKMLAAGKGQPCRRAKVSQPAESMGFQGGELVFFDDCVELLSAKIITARGQGNSMQVLRELARRDARGRFVNSSADDLARRTRALANETVIASIQTLRRNITHRLRKMGIEVKPDDVIGHDERGYFLRDWISVTTVGDGASAAAAQCESRSKPKATVDADDDAGLNERQVWCLAELRRGRCVSRSTFERRFEIGTSTAKRDLMDLARRRLVRFVREGRSGFYALAEEPAITASESP